MNRQVLTLLTGMVMGMALLSGGHAAANTILTATPSSQPIYVNGQRVAMTAYSIGGNNYVKLRDIGKAVDFGVTYDAATNSVHIDPNSPYQEEVKQIAQAPAPASPSVTTLTEENVRATILALRDIYPTNTPYPAPYRSTSNGPYGMAPSHCAGWATLCSDTAFGNLPWRRISNPDWGQIRAGDIVRYDNTSGGHAVVVLNRNDEYISTTESGLNNKARWGGQYFKWWLEAQSGLTLYTRYPS